MVWGIATCRTEDTQGVLLWSAENNIAGWGGVTIVAGTLLFCAKKSMAKLGVVLSWAVSLRLSGDRGSISTTARLILSDHFSFVCFNFLTSSVIAPVLSFLGRAFKIFSAN